MNWIDIKSKKPEFNMPVLITQYKSMKKELGRYYMVAVLKDNGCWYSEWDKDTILYNPTHWMNIPHIKDELDANLLKEEDYFFDDDREVNRLRGRIDFLKLQFQWIYENIEQGLQIPKNVIESILNGFEKTDVGGKN